MLLSSYKLHGCLLLDIYVMLCAMIIFYTYDDWFYFHSLTFLTRSLYDDCINCLSFNIMVYLCYHPEYAHIVFINVLEAKTS